MAGPHDTPPTWRWPLPARAAVGAAAGYVLGRWAVPVDGPGWRAAAAAVTVGLATPTTMLADRWAPRGLWSGLAVVSVGGLYLGVPETDHFVALAAGLGVLWLADVAGRARVDGLVVLALTAVVAWAGLWGAVSRPGAVTGAMALLGLLLVAWVAELLPGPSRPIVPRQLQSVALLALQAVFAVAVARWGALRTAALDGAVVGGVGLLLLAWLSRLVMGPRPW